MLPPQGLQPTVDRTLLVSLAVTVSMLPMAVIFAWALATIASTIPVLGILLTLAGWATAAMGFSFCLVRSALPREMLPAMLSESLARSGFPDSEKIGAGEEFEEQANLEDEENSARLDRIQMSTNAAPGFQFQRMVAPEHWLDLPAEQQLVLQQACAAGDDSVRFNLYGRQCEANFWDMCLVDLERGTSEPLRMAEQQPTTWDELEPDAASERAPLRKAFNQGGCGSFVRSMMRAVC